MNRFKLGFADCMEAKAAMYTNDKVIVPKQVRDKLCNKDAIKNRCWYADKSF